MSYLGPSKKRYIDKYSYTNTNILGQGYSGTVYLGKYQPTGNMCAIKIIQKSILKYQAHKSMILCQIQFLNILKGSQKILTIYEVYNTKNNIYLVSQLCNTDLKQYLTSKKFIPEAQAIDIMKSIIIGYNSIWKAKIIHRDLKPSNILLREEQVKIADFGFSMFQKDKKQYEKINVGSPYYMPLQVLGQNNYSYQSDIWALGIIFFQILTGRNPWKAKTEKQLFQQIKNFNVVDVLPQELSQSSKEFLERTLLVDPVKRMKPEELVGFKFSTLNYQGSNVGSRNQIRMEQAIHLQKTMSRRMRIPHDPHQQQHSHLNISMHRPLVNQRDSDKNSNEQVQPEEIAIGMTSQKNINFLAQSRMKKRSDQQSMDDVEQLPSPIKFKKTALRKTSLQVNQQPFQSQKKTSSTLLSQNDKAVSRYSVQITSHERSSRTHKTHEVISNIVQLHKNPQTKSVQNSQLELNKQNSNNSTKNKCQLDTMRNFSITLRSQIHFCRFLFKLLTRMINHLHDELNVVRCQFKQQMARFIFYKLRKIQSQKIAQPQIMREWVETREWEKIKSVLGQYKVKYRCSLQQLKIPKQFDRELFRKLLRKAILHLYERAYNAYVAEEDRLYKQSKTKVKRTESQKSTQIQQQDEPQIKNKHSKQSRTKVKRTESQNSTQIKEQDDSFIMKIKQQIIILDYLITLKQLIRLQQKYGWQEFSKKANIQTIVQGDPLRYIQQKHILAISQKLQTLKIL